MYPWYVSCFFAIVKFCDETKHAKKRVPQHSMTRDPNKVWPNRVINYYIDSHHLG